MEIGTAEISRIIKEQIRDYEKSVEIQEIGTVLSTGDGIARVGGQHAPLDGVDQRAPSEGVG